MDPVGLLRGEWDFCPTGVRRTDYGVVGRRDEAGVVLLLFRCVGVMARRVAGPVRRFLSSIEVDCRGVDGDFGRSVFEREGRSKLFRGIRRGVWLVLSRLVNGNERRYFVRVARVGVVGVRVLPRRFRGGVRAVFRAGVLRCSWYVPRSV